MQHINLERLAALADEPATLPERAHLAECSACTAELAAAQRIVRMAMTDTPAIERPITSWERLGPALRAEGLVRTPLPGTVAAVTSEVVPIGSRQPAQYRWMMQAAAGLFLAVGGAVIGRASASLPSAAVASGGSVSAKDTNFTSTSDAMTVLQHASNQYQRAVAYLAANDSTVTLSGHDAAELYQARLDALNQSVAATRAALYRAPRDPVLNQYYLSTMGARDLTLRQLGEAVPVSTSKRTRF